MSTILDALRKLQRERAAAHPSRDLRGSVTDEIHPPQPAPRSSRRGFALALIAVLALATAGGAAWLYRSGRLTRPADGTAAAVEAEADEGDSAVFSPAEIAEIARKEHEAELRDAAMDQATAAEPQPPAPVAASPPEAAAAPSPEAAPDPSVDPAAELAAERARLEAIQAEAALAAQRQAEAEAAARAAAAAPVTETLPPPTPEAQAAATPPSESPPELRAAPAPPPVPTPAAAPKPKAKPKPKSQPKMAKVETPGGYTRESLDEPVTSGMPVFPPVRVDSIRWHPISERRVASLHFEQQNVSDAHEGDIVGGVLVYRIDPGAVEIRIGSTSRVIRPTP